MTMQVADRQLLEIRTDALFTHGPDGYIHRINEPGGGFAPRFYFGRTRQGNLWRYRYDLQGNIVRRLEYRGRGHARSVVSAWAHAVRAMGRIPVYSTSWENAASQAVARKLGLIQYGVDLIL